MYSAIENLLKERIGLDVRSVGVTSVHNAIKRCLTDSGYEDLEQYYKALVESEKEFQQLVDVVVIPETWFFRDNVPFKVLVDRVKKEWLGDKSDSSAIKILSIPCSTGEEPYTIAIALDQIGFPAERTHIDAIDISQQSLDKAQRGVYRANSFRSENLGFRRRYFTELSEGFRLKSGIRKRVTFRLGNLLRDDFSALQGEYDVVFCRNLMIYFDGNDQKYAVHKLHGLLKPNGMLFVGHAEANNSVNEIFQSLRIRGAFAFVKKNFAEDAQYDYGDRLSQFSRKHGALTPAIRRRRASSISPEKAEVKPFSAYAGAENAGPDIDVKATLSEARKMADAGRLEDAERLCNQILECFSSADTYYLLGVLYEATDRPHEAEAMFRKAIYLIPDHVEALVHLALHLERGGNVEEALSLRRRAGRAG